MLPRVVCHGGGRDLLNSDADRPVGLLQILLIFANARALASTAKVSALLLSFLFFGKYERRIEEFCAF